MPMLAVRGGALELSLPLLPAAAALSATYALWTCYARYVDATAPATSGADFVRAGALLARLVPTASGLF